MYAKPFSPKASSKFSPVKCFAIPFDSISIPPAKIFDPGTYSDSAKKLLLDNSNILGALIT